MDTIPYEDCNYIGGNGFQNQRFGNQHGRGGYSGFGQRSNFSGNQNSSDFTSKPSFQTPNQSNNSFTRNYGSSSYQAPPAQTEISELKAMIEQIDLNKPDEFYLISFLTN